MQRAFRLSVKTVLGAGLGAITVFTALVTVLFLRQSALVAQSEQWVGHTHKVMEHVMALSDKLKDAALYQRNYLISKDPLFLDAYRYVTRPAVTANDDVPVHERGLADIEQRLAQLTEDNPAQQHNVRQLQEAARALIAYLDSMVELQQGSAPASLSVTNALQSKALLDRVRQLTGAMLAEENRLLVVRRDNDDAVARHNTALVLVAIGIFYAIKLLLTWFYYQQWLQTKLAEKRYFAQAQETAEANAALQQMNEQIQQSGQAKLRAVVDHAVDGIITIDARGRVQSFNPACERIFGYEAAEVIGQNINILMPEPYHSAHDGYIQHYRTTGKAAIIGTAGREVEAKRKDGSIFPIDLSVSAFKLEGQDYFSGVIRDITERKQAEAEVQRYTKELEHSNQELDDFAYIASHDLKEPLRGLYNHASFLLEDYSTTLGDDGVRRLNRLAQLAQRMERLVNDLLYFSRLGRGDLAIQKADTNRMVEDCVALLEAMLKERNARVTVPVPLPTVVCDRPRLTEVFRNLITNAIKYNDKPQPLVEIGYRHDATPPHGPAQGAFYVKDNGVGIPPEFHQEVFRIFKRLQAAGPDDQGTGVGLTFVKKIVERHHGQVWIESESGQGTTFFFTIKQEPNKHE